MNFISNIFNTFGHNYSSLHAYSTDYSILYTM